MIFMICMIFKKYHTYIVQIFELWVLIFRKVNWNHSCLKSYIHAMHACMYACMYACHACMLCMHAMYACMSCMHVCHVCMHIMHACVSCMHDMHAYMTCMHDMHAYMTCMHMYHARDGGGLLALAESLRERCRRLVLLEGERLRTWASQCRPRWAALAWCLNEICKNQ